ncbi:hypothetical protein [uncultured Shewanella sp.]|uniref:hypothetical protein n=1 Tax=uncultured Shewanella sp. TaxID=173975 RepID=UPI0026088E15|nr:hypothetical protein [uncultured Shewanella sp.]
MGIWGSISSGISSICSGVASICSGIGRGVGSFMTNVAPKLMTVIGTTVSKLNTVLAVVQAVVQLYGILKPEEKVEDIGDKAIQASEEGISMDKFDDFDAYMESLRNFDVNPERSSEIDDVTKKLSGIAVVTQGLSEKLKVNDNSLGNLWTLPALNAQVFTADRIKAILDGTMNLNHVVRYFEKDLTPQTALSVEKGLFDAEKKLSPEKTDSEIYQMLDSTKTDITKKSEQFSS